MAQRWARFTGLVIVAVVALASSTGNALTACSAGSVVLLTADDLNVLLRNNLSGNYCLGADLDLSGVHNWIPIGDYDRPFSGTLDGQAHTISNLAINGSAGAL